VHVLVDVLRVLGHREVRHRDVEVAAQDGLVDVGRHLLERIEVVADAPEHEVGVRLDADGRVREDHHRAGVAADDLREFASGLPLHLGRFSPESAVDLEEHEVDELALGSGGVAAGGLCLRLDCGGHGKGILACGGHFMASPRERLSF